MIRLPDAFPLLEIVVGLALFPILVFTAWCLFCTYLRHKEDA